ncbi:MAG: ribonuclease HII [Nitriliruptoraceae bacterium]
MVGIDEVGRGAWAGPVTVGAVVLRPDRRIYRLRDSKLLRAEQREHLAQRITSSALAVGIGHASNDEIDALGMSLALQHAALRAVDALGVAPDVALVDGNWDFARSVGTVNETIIRGDAVSASIAAASIVAKVSRDALLVGAAERFPAYAFASNKGYPTPMHRAALAANGPCAMHRHSWAPIASLRQARLFSMCDANGTEGP